MMLALVPPLASPLSASERAARHAPEERELIAAALAGERAALVQLYRAHHHHVRAFANRVLGAEGAADDLVHELFMDLPKLLGAYRGESALSSFLVGVAARRVKHHVRAAARRRSAEERAGSQPPPSSPTPERDLERRQLAERLARGLAELPLDQRIAFVMCEVEERTSVEVAALLGERDGTIRARVHLAKKKLRESLAQPEAP